jgi:acyl-CoA thioesterase-1
MQAVNPFLRFFLLGTLLLAGAACSRQSESSGRQAGSQAQLEGPAPVNGPVSGGETDDRPVIVAFGDSLTAGLGVDERSSYPAVLQRELDARGYRYRVVNAGVSGDTSGGGVARVEDVLAYRPRIVILELGANDGLRGLPVATTRANLEQIIQTLQRGGARVVLAGMTLPPNYGADYVHSFERVFVDLSKEYNLPRIPFLLEGVAAHPYLMQSDGLHPNAAGQRIVAKNVLQVLEPLLKAAKTGG